MYGFALHAKTDAFSKQTLSEMEKIKKHNKEQLLNKVSLEEYQKRHTDLVEIKDDGYWQMAWYARTADYGDRESQYIIAKAYENGTYTQSNPRKAVAFYKKAAEQGHVEASMRLGRLYMENKWVEKDLEKSLYYYLMAAKENYTPAQIKVASIYEEKKEYKKAYKWMEMAVSNMFPNEKNLEKYSPDLARLSTLMKETEEINVEKEGTI